MIILAIAYLGGVLTILSPCILPVLPFVFARADRPFRSHGLPMLLGMAFAFAGIATLAAVGGGWVVALNEYGRYAAMALLALVRPDAAVAGMGRPHEQAARRARHAAVANRERSAPSARPSLLSPLLLGIGTGLLWAPCAGPILGLILTSAALNGASAGTSLLLLAYAAGACTSLAAALLFGGRVFSALKGSLRTGEWIRRAAGAAVLVGVGAIALGLDTGVLSRLSFCRPHSSSRRRCWRRSGTRDRRRRSRTRTRPPKRPSCWRPRRAANRLRRERWERKASSLRWPARPNGSIPSR